MLHGYFVFGLNYMLSTFKYYDSTEKRTCTKSALSHQYAIKSLIHVSVGHHVHVLYM